MRVAANIETPQELQDMGYRLLIYSLWHGPYEGIVYEHYPWKAVACFRGRSRGVVKCKAAQWARDRRSEHAREEG